VGRGDVAKRTLVGPHSNQIFWSRCKPEYLDWLNRASDFYVAQCFQLPRAQQFSMQRHQAFVKRHKQALATSLMVSVYDYQHLRSQEV
jgi:hypothetical protein